MTRNLWIGLVAAVVVLAAAIGLLYAVRTVGEDELVLPETAGGLTAADDPDNPELDGSQQVVDGFRQAAEVDAAGWSEAFDGAAAASRLYLDEGLDDRVRVQAVAADAGPLIPADGFVDAERLGFALPPVERVVDGDVECLLERVQPPRAGTDYQPDQAVPDVITCQRRSSVLTVRARAAGSDQQTVTTVVDDVWDELGG